MEVLRPHQHFPREPKAFSRVREQYQARRQQTERLEARIGMTDRGLEWLTRVKQIGKTR